MFTTYEEMYRNAYNMDFIVEKRLEMVRYAFDHGIKPAAKYFRCSKNSVKKWIKRYQKDNISGLIDISRKPHNSPKRIAQEDIDNITSVSIDAKEKGKHITVNNVRKKTGITYYSDETMNRYINKATDSKRNKAHPKSNGGPTAWKKKLKPFELIQVDIKYLTDIDNLKPYFNDEDESKSLIRYQITARDVASGYPILGYCESPSSVFTKMFLEDILYPFLSQFKQLDLKTVRIQTDCGPEFTNKYKKTNGKTPVIHSFTLSVESKFRKHKTNIPGHCTANSDVESFHWSIERDCLGWDDITNNTELIKY
ncbi:MAG: leucine zipper domain-containing protein, partial [Bacilli bacterium]|nr:leucine zipper domain-containing protein [Bacilli bacterium]